MKIKSLLIGMLASVALVGCTSEDSPEVNNGNEANNAEGKAYVSVKLMMTESNGSRATGDLGYNTGVPSEQTINAANSVFLFFDVNGDFVASGDLITRTPSASGDDQSHEHSSNVVNSLKDEAYVVLSGPSDELKTCTQVLTIVNLKSAANYKTGGSKEPKRLSDVLDDIAEESVDVSNQGFLMPTSVYAVASQDETNGTTINTTALSPNNIQETQDLAKQNPVKIYIERASAKVQLKYNGTEITAPLATAIAVEGTEGTDDETTTDKNEGQLDEAGGLEGNDIVIDGHQYPVYISIDGWIVNNINPTSYLVKSIDGKAWNVANGNPLVGEAAWNNVSDFRSYWAIGTKYDQTDGTGLIARTYNNAIDALNADKITAEDGSELVPDEFDLTNNAMYCYEQTVKESNITSPDAEVLSPNATTILIAASIKIQKTADGTPEAVGNLYRYAGLFYTLDNYKELVLTKIQNEGIKKQVEKEVTTTGEDGTTTTEKVSVWDDLVADDLTIEESEELATIKITLKDGTYAKVEGGTPTTFTDKTEAAEAINALDIITKTVGYAGGKCYYQIPIEHLSSTGGEDDGEYLYGVVRNHWYQLNIKKIIRIGEAVYNPNVEIPQIPAKGKEYYMAAELHVLSWHVVEQDVTLD